MNSNIHDIIEARMFEADIDDILEHFGVGTDAFIEAVGIRFCNAMAIDSGTLRDLNNFIDDRYINVTSELKAKLDYLTSREIIKVVAERIETNREDK